MRNYYLENYGYVENPLNIKKLALDLIKGYGMFSHMRDELRDKFYNLENVLYENNPYGIPYHEAAIKNGRKKIAELTKYLKELEDNPHQLYQKYYDDGYENYRKELEGRSPAIKTLEENLGKYRRRADALLSFLKNFELKGSIGKEIVDKSRDIYLSVKEQIAELEVDISKCDKSFSESKLEDYNPMKEEDWVQKEIKDTKYKIGFHKERISEEEDVIKRLQERDKEIRSIYEALEPFNEEIV